MTQAIAFESALVVGPAWVGDMVLAHSLIRALAEANPGRPIDLMAPEWTLPLARFMPEIREAVLLPVRHGALDLRARRDLGRALREKRHDLAIVLPNSFKSALAPYLAGIPRRIGYANELRGLLLTEARRLGRRARPHQASEFAALAFPAGNEVTPPPPRLVVPPRLAEETLFTFGLTRPAGKLLALVPGAEFGPAKRWPSAHFASLAAAMARQGWAVWILGAPRDREPAAAVRTLCPAATDLTGRTTLDQAVALLSLATAAVANDSGLMHAAAALGVPLVALFGPSDAARTGPLGTALVLSEAIACRPCLERICPLGHHRCLKDLAPGRVVEALAEVA